jgi:hypothetical protein
MRLGGARALQNHKPVKSPRNRKNVFDLTIPAFRGGKVILNKRLIAPF